MIDTSAIPVTELLRHGPEMTLIDRLVSYDPTKSVATVEIGPASVFYDGNSVPGWVGIEYMAQTVAAHVGFEARQRGEPPAIGFLLGTRAYDARVARFPTGSKLTIVVEPLWFDAGVGAFRCSIVEREEVVATAVVSTYQPAPRELEPLRSKAEAS
jgi:predicted hotdog family 3-hydroxylacyl-ACP dehydratase